MSHVDEGTLHAYLDGELPSSERAAIEPHLAQCTTCRAALTEARALLERASALLGSARPVERPAPPFDQIRRAPKRSPWRVRTSLAWAASITLALGLGYYLRGPGDNQVAGYAETQRIALDRGAAALSHAPAPALAPAPAPALGAERQERPAARAAPARQENERVSTPPADEMASVQSRADSAAASERSQAVSGVVTLKPNVALRSTPSADKAVIAGALRDSGAVLEEVLITGAAKARANDVTTLRGRTATTQWQTISRGAATSLLGTDPVGLPGLATRRIRRSPAPDATVVVEQALDSTTVIQIFQRPADAALYVDGVVLRRADRDRAAREAAPAAAPAPADRLARFVGRLRVEIAGPLSLDSLNRLLEQVEPLP